MAESDVAKETEDVKLDDNESGEDVQKKGFMPIICLIVVILIAAGGGYGVSLFIGSTGPDSALGDNSGDDEFDDVTDDDEFDYYTFKSMTVALVSPRGSSYLRSTVVLKIKKGYFEKVSARIDMKKHEIKDMFNSYLGGLGLKEVLGTRNQNRIKRELRDSLNELLWPGSKPGIYQVLLEEFHTT